MICKKIKRTRRNPSNLLLSTSIYRGDKRKWENAFSGKLSTLIHINISVIFSDISMKFNFSYRNSWNSFTNCEISLRWIVLFQRDNAENKSMQVILLRVLVFFSFLFLQRYSSPWILIILCHHSFDWKLYEIIR